MMMTWRLMMTWRPVTRAAISSRRPRLRLAAAARHIDGSFEGISPMKVGS
jgi:hypothetical protein